jgi:hypothetical protein
MIAGSACGVDEKCVAETSLFNLLVKYDFGGRRSANVAHADKKHFGERVLHDTD